MEAEQSRGRRRYSRELKTQILAECEKPGASVAKVAMGHGINANVVHGWRKLARQVDVPPRPRQEFVPVTVGRVAALPNDERHVDVELHRGAMTIKLSWPMSAATDLAALMRELLR